MNKALVNGMVVGACAVLMYFGYAMVARGAAQATQPGLEGELSRTKADYISKLEDMLKAPQLPPDVRRSVLVELARAGSIKGYEGLSEIIKPDDPLTGLEWACALSKVMKVDDSVVDTLLGSRNDNLRLTGLMLVGRMAAADIDDTRLEKLTGSKDDRERGAALVIGAMARKWERVVDVARIAGDTKESQVIRDLAEEALGEYVRRGKMTCKEFREYLEGIVKRLP